MFTAPNIRFHYLGDKERAKTLRQRGARLVPILANNSSFRKLQQNKTGPYNYETEGLTLTASHVGNHVDVFIHAHPLQPAPAPAPAPVSLVLAEAEVPEPSWEAGFYSVSWETNTDNILWYARALFDDEGHVISSGKVDRSEIPTVLLDDVEKFISYNPCVGYRVTNSAYGAYITDDNEFVYPEKALMVVYAGYIDNCR